MENGCVKIGECCKKQATNRIINIAISNIYALVWPPVCLDLTASKWRSFQKSQRFFEKLSSPNITLYLAYNPIFPLGHYPWTLYPNF
jgi:hypothetical protein